MKKFIEELKRRNVIKATIAYLVVSWIVIQVALAVLPTFAVPDWVIQAIIIVMAIGLPIWIVICWIYDITPQGFEKTPKELEKQFKKELINKRLNVFIIVSLSIAVIVLTLNLSFFNSDLDKEYSIAVIPFDNIKVDQDKEWLSQNFTQNVNSYISKVEKLKVIDSYSTRKFKDSDESNSEIGNALDVSYLLRGTVTQINNKLSITVELIDVISNTVDWSESYDEKFEEDPLRLQQEVSQKIVAQLKVALTQNDEKALDNLLTKNLEASIYFNEGVRIADKRKRRSDSVLLVSANLFQKAIDLDPNYADAYAEMAFVLRLVSEDDEIFEKKDKFKTVDSLIKKSLKIDPNTAHAFTTLGMMQMSLSDTNWEKVKEYYDKALAI